MILSTEIPSRPKQPDGSQRRHTNLPKKIDANHSRIVKELRQIGATVQSLADLGKGVPDILVAWRGTNYLFEIKDWKQPPSKRRLTPDEKKWHQLWQGQVAVVETSSEALRIMGIETS